MQKEAEPFVNERYLNTENVNTYEFVVSVPNHVDLGSFTFRVNHALL